MEENLKGIAQRTVKSQMTSLKPRFNPKSQVSPLKT
jgi:hypothetical protein